MKDKLGSSLGVEMYVEGWVGREKKDGLKGAL